MIEFRNDSKLDFVSIDVEEWREYEFMNELGKIVVVRIDKPCKLYVSEKTGSHRVFDESGISHYIAPTWIHIRWKAKEGSPHFSF